MVAAGALQAVHVLRLLLGLAAALVLVGAGNGFAGAGARGWAIADLGSGTARAVNASGQIIGNGCTAECPDWAVVWQKGRMTGLVSHPKDDGAGSTAAALNDRGQVVGWTFTDSSNPSADRDHAFSWDGKTTFLRPLPGGDTSQAFAIDDRGRIVGWSETAAGARHAALWQTRGERARDLGTLGGAASAALAINGSGQVVGWSETEAGDRHAFLWQRGGMRDLGTLGGRGSEATGIDGRGQIIGISFPTAAPGAGPTGPVRAFVWENGKMTDLGTVAPIGWQLTINDRGQVAGSRSDGSSGSAPPDTSRNRAFLWANGRISYLPLPRGARGSNAYALNDRGQVVGTCEFSLGPHACLWQGGTVIDLGVLGAEDRRGTAAIARSINERGEIVGNSQHFMDFSHAVLWTPPRAG